jgi:predicted lipoprotein with Yx(FWY)xxD motif
MHDPVELTITLYPKQRKGNTTGDGQSGVWSLSR